MFSKAVKQRSAVHRLRLASTFRPIAPDRRHVGALRFDRFAKRASDGTLDYGDLLAMWVADMDFPTAPNIIEKLKAKANDGVFGYPNATRADENAVLDYLVRRHNYPRYESSSIVFLPGLVVALNVCARAFAHPNEAVMMSTPVYPPFHLAPSIQKRAIADIPLIWADDAWRLDMAAIRKRVDESPHLPRVSMFLLCNPHNPIGRVFSREEVVEILKFCKERKIVVISDEIHCDLVLEGNHISSAGLGYDDNLVVLHSPSKTFNLAGIGAGFALIPDHRLRATFKAECRGIVSDVNIFGFTSMRAAYQDEASWEWQAGMLSYLRGNRDFLALELSRSTSVKFHAKRHQGTYLAWLDCSDMMKRVSHTETKISASSIFLKEANLAVNDGKQFYASHVEQGATFVRLNFACPRETIAEAVERIAKVDKMIK